MRYFLNQFVLMIIYFWSSASKDFQHHLTFCHRDSDPKCKQATAVLDQEEEPLCPSTVNTWDIWKCKCTLIANCSSLAVKHSQFFFNFFMQNKTVSNTPKTFVTNLPHYHIPLLYSVLPELVTIWTAGGWQTDSDQGWSWLPWWEALWHRTQRKTHWNLGDPDTQGRM